MSNHRVLIQHCRSLLSLHHEFARCGAWKNSTTTRSKSNSEATSSKQHDDVEISAGTKLDLSEPIAIGEEEILENYYIKNAVSLLVSDTQHMRYSLRAVSFVPDHSRNRTSVLTRNIYWLRPAKTSPRGTIPHHVTDPMTVWLQVLLDSVGEILR